MFHSARLTLTAWYVMISMCISILFSVAIFSLLTLQLDHDYRRISQRYEQLRVLAPPDMQPPPPPFDSSILESTEDRIRLNLIYINLAILGLSGLAGYFLAGRTLKPIEFMLEEQDRFITDASHELRTPLTVLRSELEVNLREKRITPQDARTLLESNLEEVINLQVLSDNLLKLAHSQAGNNGRIREFCGVYDIAEEASRKVTLLAKQKQITIVNNTKPDTLSCDRQALIELFVIFLDNAIKYSNEKTTITLASKQTDHTLLLSVSDQGEGIEDAEIPYIFDRFYRTDKSRSKKAPSGYGLGLSIAQKIVHDHGGSISVKSTKGKGTTFSVSLPVK